MNLTATGFGPFTETTVVRLDPNGTVLYGPSGCGKNTVMNLIALALTGKMADGNDVAQKAIRGERAAIRLDMDAATIRVSVAPGPRWTRKITTPDENEVSLPTHLDLARRLDALDPVAKMGSRADIVSLILHPSAWLTAYNDGQRGRTLRDALAKILPSGDLPATVASLMSEAGYEVVDGDPMHLDDVKPPNAGRDVKPVPGAKAKQTAANTTESEKKGLRDGATRAVTTAESALAVLIRTAFTEEDVAAARAILSSSVAWEQYDVVKGVYDRDKATYDLIVSRQARYDADLAALGEAPVVDEDGERAAKAALAALHAEQNEAEATLSRANANLAAARATESAERRAKEEAAQAAERARIAQEEAVAAERTKAEAARVEAERVAAAALETERAEIKRLSDERENRERKAAQDRPARPAPVVQESAPLSLFPGLPAPTETSTFTAPTVAASAALVTTITCPECSHTWSP